MGWNDHMDDNELDNLPLEAFSTTEINPTEIDDSWLASATRDEQLAALRVWFFARYCDPAEETPYITREGGYQFIHGGPYDPADVLPERFTGIADDDVIDEIVEEMHDQLSDEWAPIRYEEQYDEEFDFDARFGLDLQARDEPLIRLKARLGQVHSVLTLSGDRSAMALVPNLALGAAVAALEAFLWEIMDYWVENDEAALRAIVTRIPTLKDLPMKLGEIFGRYDGLKEQIKGYLQNMVWHRWDRVAPLFNLGLGIEVPSFKIFDSALIKRHDIVHRSGHDRAGKPISVSHQEIIELCATIESFAIDIDTKLASRVTTAAPVAILALGPDF